MSEGAAGATLPALCARALLGLGACYATGRVPPLGLRSNLLRVLGDSDGGIRRGDAFVAAHVSRRALDGYVAAGLGAGLVDAGDGRRGAIVRLTPLGEAALAAGGTALDRSEAAWAEGAVREGLEDLVGRFELELPHYPATYGLADVSITGGLLRRPDPGAPAVPAHGQDWRPSRRAGPESAAGLPLAALVSQALVAFAIDYEGAGVNAPLGTAAVLDALATRGPLPERSLPPVHAWRPGRGWVTTETGARERGKLVRLTGQGAATAAEYPRVTAEVEAAWRDRFGAERLRAVRTALRDATSDWAPGPAGEPYVTWVAGLAAP